MRRKTGWFVLVVIILVALVFGYLYGREYYYQRQYDRTRINKPVTTKQELSKIYAELETIRFGDIPTKVQDATHASKPIYKKKLQEQPYIKLTRDDLFRKIVRDYRIKDFLSKDVMYANTIQNNAPYYLCLDKKTLSKFIELLDWMDSNDYDTQEITLRSGYRSPRRNYYIGGASQSRHIYGQAIDIGVGDINRDGSSNKVDKDLILHILDTKIIGNSGGIGLYPGTRAVHFDTRGRRARWNTYTPAIKKNK
jgi:hypothetical protein